MSCGQSRRLSFFPVPLKNELLDSLVYRYHYLSGNSHPSVTIEKLFGMSCIHTPKMFTTRINHLHSRLPPELFRNCDDLLHKHALFPAFSRIFEKGKMSRLRSISYNGIIIGMGVLYHSRPIVIQATMQCCPICINEDTQDVSTAYWHRSHQLHGAVVCHLHGCDLIDACPHCKQEIRVPRTMYLPNAVCQSCKKRFLPVYSYPHTVRELAVLAHDALSSSVGGTDLVRLREVVLEASNHDTNEVCQHSRRIYGDRYFKRAGLLGSTDQFDWINDSYFRQNQNLKYGPLELRLGTFAELLMTVQILFGSWAILDQAMLSRSKAR
jgi:hypothetical protein